MTKLKNQKYLLKPSRVPPMAGYSLQIIGKRMMADFNEEMAEIY